MFLPTTLLSIFLAASTTYPKQTGLDVQRLADVTNHLGDRLQHLLIQQPGNQLISPYGVSVMLSTLYQGVHEVTQQKLDIVEQKWQEKKLFDISKIQKMLHTSLQDDTKGNKLEEANVLLFPFDYPVSQRFKQEMRSFFDAFVLPVNYDEESRDLLRKVNNLVEKETDGKILRMVDEDDVDVSSGLTILNGIYYKGVLDIPSQTRRIKQQPFHNKDERLRRAVPTIEAETKLRYYQDEKMKAVQIPFKGRDMKMLVILPSQQFGLKEFQQQLTQNKIKQIMRSSEEAQVKLSIPEFRMKSTHKFHEDMRIPSTFRPDGEFSAITPDKNVRVSQFIHKAAIEITTDMEEDMIDYRNWELHHEKLNDVEFKVDRPFLFYIIHEITGLHLLVGRVAEI